MNIIVFIQNENGKGYDIGQIHTYFAQSSLFASK